MTQSCALVCLVTATALEGGEGQSMIGDRSNSPSSHNLDYEKLRLLDRHPAEQFEVGQHLSSSQNDALQWIFCDGDRQSCFRTDALI